MISKIPSDTRQSLVLYGLTSNLKFLINLYESRKLPKVLMLSGKKGSGKSTLINHFLNYVYDKVNYDLNNQVIHEHTVFFKQYSNDLFPNIIYLSGSNYKNVKIDDIRDLKSTINKRSLLEKERFIILDDIELFNTNSLNALLKAIEEPYSKNHFVLINNQSKPLIETIRSRSLEIKILLKNHEKLEIIKSLTSAYNVNCVLNFKDIDLTPGNFFMFNQICETNNINLEDDYLKNIKLLLNLYKKDKDINFINFIIYLTDYYFYKCKDNDFSKVFDDKSFIIKTINNLLSHNMNQTSVIHAINTRLTNG